MQSLGFHQLIKIN